VPCRGRPDRGPRHREGSIPTLIDGERQHAAIRLCSCPTPGACRVYVLPIKRLSARYHGQCNARHERGTGVGLPFEPLAPGITVKDAFTAVLVQVAGPPTFPFAGSDGKFHVAYNVVLQNASRVPATIRRLEVRRCHRSYEGRRLVR
jgi:hypothetical protein